MKRDLLNPKRRADKKGKQRISPKKKRITNVPVETNEEEDLDSYGEPCPPHPGFLVQFEKAKTISTLFKTVKDLFTHINLVCTPNGITAMPMCASNVSLMALNLRPSDQSDMEEGNSDNKKGGRDIIKWYECECPVTLGIDSASLSKLLNIAPANSRLRIYSGLDDPTSITLEFGAGHHMSKWDLKLINILDESRVVPENDKYDGILQIPSAKFNNICKNFDSLKVGTLLLYFQADDGSFRITTIPEDGSENITGGEFIYTDIEENINVIVNDSVSTEVALSYMFKFSKMYAVSEMMILYVNDNEPVRLDYGLGEIGTVSFYLAPKIKTVENF